MFGSSHCQPLNIINLWRAVSVIHLLYNSSINIGVTANKNMFTNNVQTLFVNLAFFLASLRCLITLNAIITIMTVHYGWWSHEYKLMKLFNVCIHSHKIFNVWIHSHKMQSYEILIRFLSFSVNLEILGLKNTIYCRAIFSLQYEGFFTMKL